MKQYNDENIFLKLFLAVVFTGCLTQGVVAGEFLVVDDLTLDWTFYSKSRKDHLPYIGNKQENPYAIHLNLNMDYGKEVYISLDIPEETSMLINQAYIRYYRERHIGLFSIDSLASVFASDKIQISLYRSSRFREPVVAKIGYILQKENTVVEINPIPMRGVDEAKDYFLLIIVLVFTVFVILYSQFLYEFKYFYNLASLLTYRYTDTLLTKFRTITRPQALVILFQALMMASMMMMVLHYYHNPLGDIFFLRFNPVIGWLVVFIITLFSIILKYLLIIFVSHLFDVSERANLYFIDYLRISMIFYTVAFIIISYTLINHFYLLDSILRLMVAMIVVFYFGRLLVIYFKLYNHITLKRLHLFSYLCATELIPIVIGLRFFLK